MSYQIQLREGTAATWTSANPVLAQGEEGHETDTGKRKVGDGATAWNSLPYWPGASLIGAAPLASPAFTGTPTAPTASPLTDDTQLATTAYADAAVAVEVSRAEAAEALKAPLASPVLTGSPTAPTQSSADNSTKLATTAFVATAAGTVLSSAETFATSAVGAETTRAGAAEALLAPKASPTFTGTVTVPATVNATDAAQKAYVDSVAAGLNAKPSVTALAASNITLSGAQAVDGTAVTAGQRVLATGQTAASQNGLWVVASGAWTRPADFASGSTQLGAFAFVEAGAANGSSGWVLVGASAVTVDTSSQTWTQFSGAGEVNAGTGLSKSGNTLSNTGVLSVSAADGSVTVGGTAGAPAVSALGAQTAAIAASLPTLAQVSVATSGTLALNTVTTVTAATALTQALPASVTGALIVVERASASAANVAVTGNVRGVAAQTITLSLASESEMFFGYGGSWWPLAGHKTLGSLDARYGRVVTPSGDATGATDPAALNAAITAAAAQGGGTVTGLPTGPWYLSAPVVLKSNVTLDMTGCVITEVAGSNCNMVTNASAVATATTGTGAMTSGGNTLTTSLGATATVGQSVYVAVAANGGADTLCGIVGAATSTTITVVDLYGNPLNAEATVSGVTVRLYSRDSKIEVKGGTWNRGANGFTGGGFIPAACGNNFRRVDGLHVHDLATSCTDKGYQTLYGDCTNFHFHDITVSAPINFSTTPNTDGVDGWGPLALGTIENIFGTNGDDFVSLLCHDPGLTRDISGPITDVTVRNLFPGQGASPNGGAGCTLYSGSTFTMRRVHVEDVHGSSRTYGVSITSASGVGTNPMDDIFISRVDNAATNSAVGIKATGAGSITLRDIAWPGNASTTSGDSTIYVDPASNIGTLTVDGMNIQASAVSVNGILFDTGCTVASAILKNISRPGGAGENVFVHGTVSVLSVQGMRVTSTTSGHGLFVDGSVAKLHLADVYYSGSGRTLLTTGSTAAAMQVLMSNVSIDAGSVVNTSSVMDIVINGLNAHALSAGTLITLGAAASTVTVRGSGLVNPNSYPLFSGLGTPTTPPRVVTAEALADISQLNRSFAGDAVYNTNASLTAHSGSGNFPVGPAVSTGSGAAGSWVSLANPGYNY